MTTSNLRLALIIPAVMVSILAASDWSDLRKFDEKRPFVATEGSVASLDCGNHGSYRVTYTAGGLTVTGGAGGLFRKMNCGALRPNEKVPVWYSSADPSYAAFTDPAGVHASIRSEIFTTILIGYPSIALFLFLGLKLKLSTKMRT